MFSLHFCSARNRGLLDVRSGTDLLKRHKRRAPGAYAISVTA